MALIPCPECKADVSDVAASCPKCGYPLTEAEPDDPPRPIKSRGVAVFLALLLGGIGAHKFYLDRPGMGLLYLVFCWTLIPAIISLFEGLGYLFMSNESFQQMAAGS